MEVILAVVIFIICFLLLGLRLFLTGGPAVKGSCHNPEQGSEQADDLSCGACQCNKK